MALLFFIWDFIPSSNIKKYRIITAFDPMVDPLDLDFKREHAFYLCSKREQAYLISRAEYG